MFHKWRLAARSVVQRRASTLAILLTLTLGIGANSAIFSAIDTILLKPLPYPASDRLVSVFEVKSADASLKSLVAPVRLEEWNRMSGSFDGLAAGYFENMTDTSGPLPERVEARRTSPRYFAVLGTPAALGRTTTPDEERFGGPAVVVLSDAFWRRRFNADHSIVGRSLMLSGTSRTIVGVMPPAFRDPTATTDVWIPSQTTPDMFGMRQARFYTAFGRLKAGLTPESAREELNAIQAGLGRQFPETDAGWAALVSPLKEQQVGGVRRSLWLLFGAALFVLLAACGNIACLLLADAARREHEVAVRFALGATRGTIVRQLLREGLLLSLVGSLAGLVLARWGIDALRTAATQLPRAQELHVDARLVTFTLTLGVLTTMLFALAPALQTTAKGIAATLAHGARGHVGGRQWLQRSLVAAQISFAIVLLVGAGLLIRSFSRLQQVSPGFDSNNMLTFRMSASWSERPDAVSNRQLRTLQALTAIPGVVSASLNSVLPAGADLPPAEFAIRGRETGERRISISRGVSADYFKTLRIPVLQGESCRDEPKWDVPNKLLVSRSFADRFFPGENPIGHRIVRRSDDEIIGVVADVREQGLAKPPEPLIYVCGLMPFWPDPYYLVRIDPARPVTMTAIRQALQEIEPRRAVYQVATLDETLTRSIAQPRLNSLLLALFAAVTLTLASVGLYGMLAQFVAERRREIGLRLALGAAPRQVLAQLLRHGAAVAASGVVVGMAAALVLARFMTTLVFELSSRDPLTFAVVPLLLVAVAVVATIVPARRAVRVDPMRALRQE